MLVELLSCGECPASERLQYANEMLFVWEAEMMCVVDLERQAMPPPAEPATGLQWA